MIESLRAKAVNGRMLIGRGFRYKILKNLNCGSATDSLHFDGNYNDA